MLGTAASILSFRTDGGEWVPPTVSIVVPVYNDPDGIQTTLESLTSLSYPSDRYEVIVVDNDSTDETASVVESFTADHENVTLRFEREVQSSYAARNTGIEHATGEVLSFVDADMHVDADWLIKAIDELDTSGADYMGCHVELYTPGEETTLADRFNARSGFDIERYVTELSFAPTCCLFVRREVVDDVGVFDQRLVSSGDLEFGNRVADAGYELHYAEDVTMYHPTRHSLQSNVKKSVRIGRGRYQLSRYYPERYGSPLVKLCNPVNYLPPIPWLLGKTFRGWEALSTREKLSLYAIASLASFARSYGRIREAIDSSDADRATLSPADHTEPVD